MRLKPVLFYTSVAAAVAAALVVVLRLWERRLDVPFIYSRDGVFFTVLVKATAEDGPLHFRHIGMPFGVEIADWGAGMPFDSLAQRALVALLGEAGTAINCWWLLSVVATGVLAAYAFRALGLRSAFALGLGYLYALSPYAFYRNIGHVSLVYHFVPLIALLALRTAEGRPESLGRGARAAVLLGCAGQGLSYIYYGFFGCLLLGASALLGWLRTRRLATVRLALAGVLLIVAGTAAGLLPSLSYWKQHGRTLQYKRVLEADMLGLKLRHLLIPIPDHPFPAWRSLAQAAANAHFPDENENAMGRLGTIGSLGLLGLLGVAVGSAAGLVRREDGRLSAAAALTLVSLLVALTGGLGSIFNLLVTPDIRAYNRIFVFIAFFCLLAVGVFLERLETALAAWVRPTLFRGGVLVVLLAAVFDQASTSRLLSDRPENVRQFDLQREFVRRIESRLPPGAMVFQLPHTGMPIETVATRMETYDQGRPYLHSRTLRWSWGAIIGRNDDWQNEAQYLPPDALVRRLALAGFSGVWIDRLGYDVEGTPVPRRRSDGFGPNPEAALARAAGRSPQTSLDERYAFISLRRLQRELQAEASPASRARPN